MNEPTARGKRANERAPIRHRWTAKPPGDSDEALAGALLRTAKTVQPWPTRNLAEVAARLRSRERHLPRKWAWQIAIAVGLLLFGGVVSAAVMHFLRGPFVRPPLPADPTSMPARVSARRKHVVAAQPPAPAVPPVPELPPVSATSERGPESLPGKASFESSPAPLANPSALAQESRLLAGAIHKLRQERNPGQALAMLDQHRARFGAKGALEPEAEVTRIEALLRLGRHDQALVLLDAQALTAAGVGREMLVARAELRAEKGRCGAALNDFNLLLATEASPDLVTERALYGRATCRAQQSDWAGARSDLEHYLARFPKGRFADQARTAIGR
jgi:TolA-binding protein